MSTDPTPDPVKAFLDWLIAMDEPDNADGMKARQTVTLTEIIRRAHLVQSWRELADSLRTGREVAGAEPGSYVHHLDGDPRNNDLGNLIVVQPEDHA